jgi:adenylate kinase family enzyme
MQRVSVIGNTGSGKSTFARALSSEVDLPHVDLDDLFWNPGWVETPDDEFGARVAAAIADDEWIVSGNYLSRVAPMVWARADTIIWLDLPLAVVLYRSVTRTIRRAVTREVVCNGNREKLRFLLPVGETPLWVFAIRHQKVHRPRIEQMLTEQPHATIHRLRSRAEVSRFLGAVSGPTAR